MLDPDPHSISAGPQPCLYLLLLEMAELEWTFLVPGTAGGSGLIKLPMLVGSGVILLRICIFSPFLNTEQLYLSF
jgi:hypothetical protein